MAIMFAQTRINRKRLDEQMVVSSPTNPTLRYIDLNDFL